MRHEFGPGRGPGVLDPSLPMDIGPKSQQRRIVDAMVQACAELSFARLTIADIVEHAAISRGTFYKNFANKRECFQAAVKAVVDELIEVASNARQGATSSPQAIQMVTAALLAHLAAKPSHAKLVLIEATVVDSALIAEYRQVVLDAVEREWTFANGKRFAGADAATAFGRAQVLVADYVADGRCDQLPELLPEIVYIALLPFVGQKEALKYQSTIYG